MVSWQASSKQLLGRIGRAARLGLGALLVLCLAARTSLGQPIGTHSCELGDGSAINLSSTIGPIFLDAAGNGTVELTCGEPAERSQCTGDCDGDGAVHVDELVLGVRAALRQANVAECTRLDRNGNNHAEIDEMIASVGSAIDGCPAGVESAECTCDILDFAPLDLSGIGFVCLYPAATCPAGQVSCSGGDRFSVDLYAERVIGACESNSECEEQCTRFCAERGTVPTVGIAGCEGYCLGGERDGQRCDCDAPSPLSCNPGPAIGDCPGGSCPGQNRAPGGLCQCQCLDSDLGPATAPGGLQCNLGATLAVEQNTGVPCDGVDLLLEVPNFCIPLTTDMASTTLHNVNDQRVCRLTQNPCENDDECEGDDTCDFAQFGPLSATGSPLTCEQLRESTSGLHLNGVVTFFGSDLGDLLAQVSLACE